MRIKDLFLKLTNPKAYQAGMELITELKKDAADAQKVKALIDQGAALRLTDPESGTDAPMLAVLKDRADLLQLMIDKKIDLNRRYASVNAIFGNVSANTLLDWSIASRHACAKMLIECGADINQQRPGNYTFLMETSYMSYNKDSLALAHLMIARGATVWERDDKGMTALHHAARGGHDGLVKALLDKDAELINMVDKNDETPLMTLFKHPYVADTNYQPHLDLEKDLAKVAVLLIARGADLTVRNKQGKTALDLAQANNHNEIAVMIEAGIAAQIKKTPKGPQP
ncbi:MAG: ankyrin repeat domain-containing protein [Alphaproteobacteria bacterium]|nr:ankyrin repeat domain-containing protein [Alphaproteobacteria bacterium]